MSFLFLGESAKFKFRSFSAADKWSSLFVSNCFPRCALQILVLAVILAGLDRATADQSPPKRYLGQLINVTFWPSGWGEVEFMSGFPTIRVLTNFDLGKLQTVDVLSTPEACINPLIFIHSEMSQSTQDEYIRRGLMSQDGRLPHWPKELPNPNGPPAFVFFDREGNVIANPDPDAVLFMKTCADYVTIHEASINEDWRKRLLAREGWARQAAIEAAKPRPPFVPPRVIRIERKPGIGVPGKLRQPVPQESEKGT